MQTGLMSPFANNISTRLFKNVLLSESNLNSIINERRRFKIRTIRKYVIYGKANLAFSNSSLSSFFLDAGN